MFNISSLCLLSAVYFLSSTHKPFTELFYINMFSAWSENGAVRVSEFSLIVVWYSRVGV